MASRNRSRRRRYNSQNDDCDICARPKVLSITTRGIGFATCQLKKNYEPWLKMKQREDNMEIPLYAMYRLFLGLLESKLYHVSKNYPVFPRLVQCFYQYNEMVPSYCYLNIPKQICEIINAVGCLKNSNQWYIPAVARKQKDNNGNFVPRPENILLSSLRETVVALASSDTPLEIRNAFYNNNPIPGARWSERRILLNPEDIMPGRYNIQEDYNLIRSMMSRLSYRFARNLGSDINMNTLCGKPSLFICNKMEDLRCQDLEDNQSFSDIKGNVSNYYALKKISYLDCRHGQINLLGEVPETLDLLHPLYIIRHENVASHYVRGSYTQAVYWSEGMLLKDLQYAESSSD